MAASTTCWPAARNVNVLVLDTEVYSQYRRPEFQEHSTGCSRQVRRVWETVGQDLGLLAIAYGDIYVGRIAMGANDAHTVRTFLEAESYDGPSLIIAYSVCIAHGYDLRYGARAAEEGRAVWPWPLYRYDPRLAHDGGQPFQFDSKPPSIPLQDYIYAETRYRMLTRSNPAEAKRLLALAESDIRARWATYEQLAR
jgi:pyruvate-ferredoxin/flavodoxin oxidoreductase